MTEPSFQRSLFRLIALLSVLTGVSCRGTPWPPGIQEVPDTSPPLSPEEALETFYMPPGYSLELVASEPLIEDPVAIDFDADGRLWVVEMRAYMPNLEGEGEDAPLGRIVVLQDEDDDGRMDHRTVYMDSLVMPRAVKVLERGVLVAAPPHLWLTRDTDGDLRADTREVVRDDYGNRETNPEHLANGLVWGIDNWIHNAKYRWEFRPTDQGFEHRPTPRVGQWGVSSDDYGRLFRNYNSNPLRVDLVPSHYFARHSELTRTRGVYEQTIEDRSVWPVRPNTGVNRGYREGVLRQDSSLAHFTAAGSPVVYRGDRLPAELHGDVFVSEPAGNLVRRFEVVENPDGSLSARNAYEEAEFLASTDERFRPVNLFSAPDGTLYIVDMYRGIIQHRRFVTDYLEDQIRQRDLEAPLGMGRIYRVVHRSTRRAERPRLSEKSPADLVEVLSHPNGWWRETAQRLLVERGDRSVAPELRRLALQAEDDRVRLHALWTLEGLGEADPETLRQALADDSPYVRAAALRVAEPFLADAEHGVKAAVLGLMDDPAPQVRWQLAASLGELPSEERVVALTRVLERYGDDPLVVDAAISGLEGQEILVLQRLLQRETLRHRDAVVRLAATVLEAERSTDLKRLFGWIRDGARPREQRLALLAGIRDRLPGGDEDGGVTETRELAREPTALLAAAEAEDEEVRSAARQVLARLRWPGKPLPDTARDELELTPAEKARFAAGKTLYQTNCAGCHQEDGTGMEGVAKRLVGSEWVLGRPGRLIRILLHGKEGDLLMPPQRTLDDEEIAAVLTYIRREWGNQAKPITPAQVREIRGYTTGRDRPWTEEELAEVR